MADSSAEKAPKLPIPGRRNILITSALPYVNNVPHLGNIIGCVLSADVFARYCRLRGYNTIYMCGTDEYGTATETKAMEEKCSPKEICDKYHAIHRDVYEWFDISFDKFGRTSAPQQTEVCQAIFHKLLDNKWLSENTMQQLYCDTCKRFLADRLVEGTCPTLDCNYDSARGDQCEKCGKLLNPTELKDPKCKVCHTTPRIRDTDHLFLELPLLREKLEEYINTMSVAGSWSQNAIQATNAWLKEGLRPRCITRDLKWGVPVPHEKYKDKVFYVWFDAPIGYISITACYTPEWEQWWKNPDNVELYQFMGKDNVPFHTVMFPSTLLGTGERWTMMKTISVTEYLNYEAGKFSKSKGIGVFGNDAKDTKIPTEVWRYYLLTNRPEVSDTLFTWVDLQAKLNTELLNNLGNFINRVLSFIAKPEGAGYGSIIPDASNPQSQQLTTYLGEKVGKLVDQYLDAMEKVKLKQGLKIAMSISSEGNAYLQESQFWKLYKEDPSSCAIVMKTSVGLVYLLACLLEPFMPSFSVEVLRQLNLPLEANLSFCDENGETDNAKRPWDFLPSGHRIGKPEPLFKELKDEDVESFRVRFAGSQADRIVKAETDANKVAEQLKATKITGNAKKQQNKPSGNTKAKTAETEISVSKLDVRVGLIKKVQKHPDADSLYVEEIDVGEESPRTVVSGLVKYIPLEEMQNRKVCVLCNLKPVTMRGIKSHAMVLAASNDDHTKVELVDPPSSGVVGERVTFPGYSGEPDGVLSAKSKVWERVQVDLQSNSELVACYKDVPFTTSAGVCKVSSIANGAIR
ncbi:Putative tRNA binding domain [Musa troglodytarum]|uniref:methionine--tRNA ligase n=1 Tax=Musa troglodytarum TaxID=320322 RepID=A0A9E7H785_9LILI|nr:Putative tRNA binding domain [Musa troglodytarum]